MRIGRLSDSSIVAVPVGKMRRVVVASPELLRSAGRPKHPRELAELPCVRCTALTPGTTWHFVENGKAVTVQISGPLSCNMAPACVAGLGFGLFISYQVAREIEAKRLKDVLTEFEPAPLPVSIVFPHARFLSSRVRTFIDFAAAELRRALAAH